MSTKFSKALAVVALCVSLTCATSRARADLVDDPILTIDGTIGRFELATTTTEATFKFLNSFTTQLNGIDVDYPTSFGNLVLSKSATAVAGGTTYAFASTSPLVQTITGLPHLNGADNLGVATFDLGGAGSYALVPTSMANTIALTGAMVLASNTSDYDFSGFAMNPSTFTFTLNMATGSFTSIIGSTNLRGKGSGSFSDIDPPAVAQQPEPSTVVLLLSAGITGLCYGWRRRRPPGN